MLQILVFNSIREDIRKKYIKFLERQKYPCMEFIIPVLSHAPFQSLSIPLMNSMKLTK